MVATPEIPHSGSPIELFAGYHRSRADTSIRQYTGLEVAVEEDDYYSEEDLSHENEKEVAYSEDMDWKMDDDMSVTVSSFGI